MKWIAIAVTSGAIMGWACGSGVAAPGPPGDNVLVVAPTRVHVPAKLPGDCHVDARVLEVGYGSGFKVGQAISIAVPCSDGKAKFDSWPAAAGGRGLALDPVVLSASKRGFVHLDNQGQLIWTGARRLYGPYGRAAGYRILDGVKPPLDRPDAA